MSNRAARYPLYGPDAKTDGKAPLIAAEDAVRDYLAVKSYPALEIATARVAACWHALHRGPVVDGRLWWVDVTGELVKVPAAVKGLAPRRR